MHDQSLEIKILNLHWINHEDDPKDLCAHGSIYVRIGNKVLVDRKEGDSWTLSVTALYLLRTIDRDYKESDYGNQLIPHCGFFMIANDSENFVTITGCPLGIDWTITHENDLVKHTADSGEHAVVDLQEYQRLVFDFVEQVEDFYKNSKPKELPEDEFDLKGYRTFWNEWRALRSKWN